MERSERNGNAKTKNLMPDYLTKDIMTTPPGGYGTPGEIRESRNAPGQLERDQCCSLLRYGPLNGTGRSRMGNKRYMMVFAVRFEGSERSSYSIVGR